MHGKGELTYRDGDKYIGEWNNNIRYGDGQIICINGDKHIV